MTLSKLNLDGKALIPQEIMVIRAAANGETHTQTAKKTYYSYRTVTYYRRSAFRKLNAKNMAHAVAICYQRGILSDSAD